MRLHPCLSLLLLLLPVCAPATRLELRQAETGRSQVEVMVGQEIEVELWIDSEGQTLSGAAVFLSFDEGAFSLVQRDRVPQAGGFQPFAPGRFLGNGEIFRNYLLDETDPAANAPGLQLDYSVVRAADQGQGPVASFRLRTRTPTSSTSIRIDESGIRETRVFLPDGSQQPFRFITPLRILVRGISLTDLPERLVLPRGGVDESTFRLDDIVFDPVYKPSEIRWTFSTISSLGLLRDPLNNVLRITAPADSSPWERLVLQATNPDGHAASDTVDIFVNAAPQLDAVGPLVIAEDGHYDLALDALVEDPDTPAAEQRWQISATQELQVAFEGPPYRARITPLENWNGRGRLKLQVADPFDFADSLEVEVQVQAVNDPPFLRAAPNVRLTRGKSDRSLLLADLLGDAEDAPQDLRLSWSGAEHVRVEVREGRLQLTAAGDWVGTELITLLVEDREGLTASAPLTVTVVPSLPPSLVGPPRRLNMAAGTHALLALGDLVVDPDDAREDLSWQISGQRHLRVQLGSGQLARIEAPAGFHGIEELAFSVSDPTGESASFSLRVFSAPPGGEPLIASLPALSVPLDGVDTSLDLDDYIFDLDHEPSELVFFLPERDDLELRVDPLTHVLVVSPNARALPGTYDLELRVVDPDGHEAVQTLRLHLEGDAPAGRTFELAPAPRLELAPGASLSIDLDEYVRGDIDPAQIRWTATGIEGVSVRIDSLARRATLSAAAEWEGRGEILFAATAPGMEAKQLSMHLTSPAALALAQLPPLTLRAGDFDQSLDLDHYVSGGDPASIQWEVSGQEKLRVLIDAETHRLIVVAAPDWSGEEVLVLRGRTAGGQLLEGTLRVQVLAPPRALSLREIGEIPLLAGTSQISLDLNELLPADVDRRGLTWQASGTRPLRTAYEAAEDALIIRAETPWQSSEILTLSVRDSLGNAATGHVLLQVYPLDGSAGSESPDFQLAVLPNPVQPEYLDIFVISGLDLKSGLLLRLQDGSWRDLSVEEHTEGIWHSSHILAPGQQGPVDILALGIASGQIVRAALSLSQASAHPPSAKPLVHSPAAADAALEPVADRALPGEDRHQGERPPPPAADPERRESRKATRLR